MIWVDWGGKDINPSWLDSNPRRGGYQSKVDWIVIQGEWIAIQELSE